jgi:hypothetical protein
MAFSLTGSIASFLHFRQARFDGADEKRRLAVHKVPVRRVVQRGGWFRHFASDVSITISEETMFLKQMYIIPKFRGKKLNQQDRNLDRVNIAIST